MPTLFPTRLACLLCRYFLLEDRVAIPVSLTRNITTVYHHSCDLWRVVRLLDHLPVGGQLLQDMEGMRDSMTQLVRCHSVPGCLQAFFPP
jgi:hypothetical protein